jgi:hypothetical protein
MSSFHHSVSPTSGLASPMRTSNRDLLASLIRQTTPSNQSTRTITTTPPSEMGRNILASSGLALWDLGCSSVTWSKASGRTTVWAGSNSDSIPMSILTHSHYIGRDAKASVPFIHLVMWRTKSAVRKLFG